MEKIAAVKARCFLMQYALREIKNDYRKSCCQLLMDDIKQHVEDPAVKLALVKVLSRIN